MYRFAIPLLALCFATFASAQYPYPTGPGTYPPGQNPNGRGLSIPHRSKKSKDDKAAQPTLSADGMTVSNDGKKLIIVTNDGRTITMSLAADTKFTRSGNDISSNKIIPRTTVHTESAEDDEAFLTALHIDLLKDAPVDTPEDAHDQSAAAAVTPRAPDEDLTPPTILKSPDAPGRPVLRRGKPATTSSDSTDDTADDQTAAANPPPKNTAKAAAPHHESGDFTIDTDAEQTKAVPRSGDELIQRTEEWAVNFTQGLPNFVCEQMTTRYAEESRSSGWQPLDVVTAKVVYEDGKESYKEITVGGKRTNKSMMELGGSTSTGEFASTLHSLFSPASDAQFKRFQSTSVNGSAAVIYDFKVALRRSDWFITVGGQTLRPAYSGSVWINKSDGEVRRIEMQADNIPKDFPLDSMEWAVDYDEVPLGTAKFLLPVHAENLGCRRGTTICTKNSIDFRDYHKYSGESTITFK